MKSKILTETMQVKGRRSTIICVDDERMVLSILYEQLTNWFGENYNIEKALSGEEALEILDEQIKDGNSISVVISDYIMPNMKGDELLAKVNERDPKIKKIMLTGYTSITGIMSAINNAGLYRFILKPWDQKDLMLTLLEAIKSYEQEKKMIEISNGFKSLYLKYEENFLNTVKAISSAIDAKDSITANHSERVRKYSLYLAKEVETDESILKNLECMAILHDVGKIGISDEELIEVNRLDTVLENEYLLRQIDIAMKIVSNLNDSEILLKGIQYCFEKYNGSGPYGLKGKEIPFEARIIGIANYYDLLRLRIVDGKRIDLTTTIKKLEEKKGTWFDPEYVDVFVGIVKPVR